MTISICLPLRCVNSLNRREHWRIRSARANEHRLITAARVRQMARVIPAPPLLVTLTRVGPRLMDDDGNTAALKHVRDGVADALDIDDGDARLQFICEQATAEYKLRGYAVRVQIEHSGRGSGRRIAGLAGGLAGGAKVSAVQSQPLKAPFPAFGGKSKIAHLAWERLGDVRNFVEPFCFSAAMLLLRPHAPKIETINDLNAFVANFWRAVKSDPEATAAHADWPVNETDLHARHAWLVNSEAAAATLKKVQDDPDHYDAKIAGWWCWGACMWIGSGWCDETHRNRDTASRPQLSEGNGRGVHANDAATACGHRREWLVDWMIRLSDRLRPVRVCCGHWDRVCDSDSTLTRLGLTGVFFDPPYRKHLGDGTENRASHIYANDKHQDVNKLVDEVEAWCLKWGDDPQIRIAVCGLEGEYPKLDAAGWDKLEWKSGGGYGNRTDRGKENAARERIWFNKSCIDADAVNAPLFSGWTGGGA